jgi:chromosome segregation ATPase
MGAHLESAEALIRLRLALLQFIERAGHAVDTSSRSLQNGYGWLRETQLPALQRQLRDAEMRFGEARVAYNSAKLSVRMDQKASFEEEERQFLKARAQFERCQECLQRTVSWQHRLEKEGQALIAPIRQLARRIEEMRERGVGELERKIEQVQTYLGQAGGAPT